MKKNEQIQLSLIIVVFNNLTGLKDTLTSIGGRLKNLNDRKFEVLIVDGFSNDGTFEYARKKQKENKSKHLVIRCFQKNQKEFMTR